MPQAQLADVIEMAAGIRVRLIRSELHAGNIIAVYKSRQGDGDVSTLYSGHDAIQPRAASSGSLISLQMSDDQNATYAKDIRNDVRVFLPMGGATHPIHHTAQRVRLLPRHVCAQPIQQREGPNEIQGNLIGGNASNGPGISNCIWPTSTAFA